MSLATHGDAVAVACVPGGSSPVATRVRPGRRRTNEDMKGRFCPWRVSRTTSGHRVSLLLFAALTEHHVPPVSDKSAPQKAGPQISEME
jgi:hypothetical protein